MKPNLEADLISWAKQEYPKEMCGFIMQPGEDEDSWCMWPIDNISKNPEHRFEMDPEEIIEAYTEAQKYGVKVIGVFHSHPTGPPQPSDMDRQYATLHGHLRQWIVTLDGVHEWSSDGNGS